MQLTTQSPHIQDVPAFVRAMAEVLAKMHASQQAHGGIVGQALQNWLCEGGVLDKERFEAAALPAAQQPEQAMQTDVHSFVAYCIGIIAGGTVTSGQPFTAAYYEGREWPLPFLQLLETFSREGAQSGLGLADFSQALQPHVPGPAITVEMPEHEPAAGAAPAPPPEPEAAENAGAVTPPPLPSLAKVATVPAAAAAAPGVRFALRNATVGKPYSYEPGAIAAKLAEAFGHDPARAYISHLQLPEDHGLVFDKQTGAVSGTPTRPFEGELSLDYVPAQSAGSIHAKVSLLINPDPASLWKDLPPPAAAPYQKPVLEHSEERHGPFRIVAASRRGRSHANKGEFRDDDYAIGYAAETGWLVVVVADGAGSASYSRRGSQIACAAAKGQLMAVLNSVQHNHAEALYAQHRDWLHPEVRRALRQALYAGAYAAHTKLAEEVQQPAEALPAAPKLRNYDTTLIMLVMKKAGDGCVAATFSIGDGGAGLLPNAEEGLPLSRADSGEHAGQTLFLTFPSTLANTEENLEARFHMAQTQEFAGAAAMTDGITDPKFPSDAAFADPAQWAALWAELQPALASSQSLLDWMNFFSPGNHDDRTLVAVLPCLPAAPALSDTP